MDPKGDAVSLGSSASSSDGEWQDIEPDQEQISVLSFFDDVTFSDAKGMLDYCREKYGFDFLATQRRLGLDFHGAVKLCNFVRRCARSGQTLPAVISAEDIEDDELLRPVLDDDGLIIELSELIDESNESGHTTSLSNENDLVSRNRILENELSELQEQFKNYRLAVEETLDRRWGSDPSAPSTGDAEGRAERPRKSPDTEYWESYAGRGKSFHPGFSSRPPPPFFSNFPPDIHETMLKDVIRTDAYRDFVYGNKEVFHDKVVLDIGCGTGILSMFCAKAGAKKVLAVDNSSIIQKARQNVIDNGLTDIVTCIAGRIEDVTLPVEKVDVIISEWMGYCLLYEAMLPSILWARDRYLKPDGLLVPSVATIFAAPVSDDEYISDNVSFWDDVYGFSMKSMQEGIFDEAEVNTVPTTSLCGEPFLLTQLQLRDIKSEDLTFTTQWSTQLNRDINRLDGFLIWFDIFFTASRHEQVSPPSQSAQLWKERDTTRVAFTTGPFGTETHWKQGLLLAPPVKDETSNLSAGLGVSGETAFSSLESDSRALSIRTSWKVPGRKDRSRTWKLR